MLCSVTIRMSYLIVVQTFVTALTYTMESLYQKHSCSFFNDVDYKFQVFKLGNCYPTPETVSRHWKQFYGIPMAFQSG